MKALFRDAPACGEGQEFLPYAKEMILVIQQQSSSIIIIRCHRMTHLGNGSLYSDETRVTGMN